MTSILYCDRSGAETDDKCGMAYWWNRKQDGIGIVPVKENFHFKIGHETHEDLAMIAELEDISPAAINSHISEITSSLTSDDLIHQEEMEVLYRRLGWLAAYALYLEPRERETFENVEVEKETILDRSPLWTAVTPDNVRRHRTERYLKYREFKTVRNAGAAWMAHWAYAIQIHLGIKAVEEELSERVAYGQVVGLLKGEYRDGKLSHPYVWAWYNAAKDEWTHEYEKARTAAWERRPVWEYAPGVVAWVQKCGPETARAQFPHSAPVFLNDRMLDNWVRSRTAREVEIEAATEMCRFDLEQRMIYFPQRTSNCRPSMGDPCPYLAACWNAAVQANPLASGLYERREPHHTIELTLIDGVKETPAK